MAEAEEDNKDATAEGESDPIMKDQDKSRRMCAYWKSQIEAVDEETQRWHKRGSTILKRFRDERDRASEEGQRRLNILWSNIQILKPALYGKRPMPIAERRFLDHDPKGRTSALILERALRNEIEENGYHDAVSMAVDDRLLPGRGQVWVRYEPEIGESVSVRGGGRQDLADDMGEIEEPDESDEEEKLESTDEQVIAESVPVDHIHWRDYYEIPARARTWKEVQAIGKRVFMSKRQCIERFGEEIGEKIQADTSFHTEQERTGNTDTAIFQDIYEKERIVYEIWNKEDRKVYWISTGYDHLCDCRADPLKLKHFFPVPEPLSATMTTDTRIPVPDYMEYQDQAIQIDELTSRINMLAQACKVAGVYDASMRGARGGLDRLLDESVENQLIPVESWSVLAERGGLKGCIDFIPLDQIVKTIEVLIEVRSKILEDLDRVTAISDILRGTTDARETLGAQRLKANSNSARIDKYRDEVGRFARDVLRIIAEIMCKHFSNKSLIEMSGILQEEGIASLLDASSLDQMGGGGMSAPTATGQPSRPPMPALPPPSQPAPGAPPGASPPPASGNVVPLHPQGPPGQQPPPAPTPNPMMQQMQQQMQQRMAVMQSISKIQGALQLLRDEVPRGYRIDIETDTMVQADMQQERQDSIEFIDGMMKFMEAAAQLAAGQPQAIPLLGKMLQFGVRKFRGGRDLEAAVDEYVDKVDKMAAQGGMQQHPDPQQQIAMIKMQTEQAKSKAEIEKSQIDMQAQQANDQREQQLKQMEFQQRSQMMQQEMAMAERKMQAELAMQEREQQMKLSGMAQEEQFKNAAHQRKMTELQVQAAMPKAQPKPAKPTGTDNG